MSYDLPGSKTRGLLVRGLPHLRNGLWYQSASQHSAAKGFDAPAQIMVDRAEGDHVWDMDGNQYDVPGAEHG